MNDRELRQRLETLLENELGKYSNGIPSIWVFGSGSMPPSSSNGLEVLIKKVPSQSAQNSSGGVKYKPQRWEVLLKNFIKSDNLAIALSKIEANFNVTNYTHTPATEELIEQCRLFIFDPIGISSYG